MFLEQLDTFAALPVATYLVRVTIWRAAPDIDGTTHIVIMFVKDPQRMATMAGKRHM